MKQVKRWACGAIGSLALMAAAASHAGTVVIPADVTLDQLIGGLSSPLSVRDAGDGSGRLFIVEQDGLIRIWDGTQVLNTPFLDVSGITTSNGERGLLGLTFHPDYENNGRFFINFTADGQPGVDTGTTVVAEYQVSAGNPNVADANSQEVIFTITQDFSNHNGGDIKFGPDGYLYIGMGDGGSGNDPCNRAQTLDPNDIVSGGGCESDQSVALLGKMIRIDINNSTPAGSNELCAANPDGSAPYAIPNDNPFSANDGNCDEIWSYGLRNPFRFSFDRETGDLWMGDVGQNVWEEVNFEPAGTAGLDYGWRACEGAHPSGNNNPSSTCPVAGAIDPVLEYNRQGTGDCSVIGGFRYRGPVNSLTGTYIFGDFCSGRIWFAQETSPGNFEFELTSMNGNLLSGFGEDSNGEVYITSFGAGAVFRFNGLRSDVVLEDGFEAIP
ncbi:MAG: PQQ-dependent sugar dehydrogenase [Xanthomonadales bacterium]|jgi:glucose/arabinose dehydrogenase|nr:PQQ-dependent sugar dehydrogenase [Xanthomonadales bacterium]